jgi:undecaprenyl diphosphate synthase
MSGAPLELPTHIGCIPDGNGRWAESRGLERSSGHEAGERATADIVFHASDLGVRWFTVFAFSTENWTRPPLEVAAIMVLIETLLVRRTPEFLERDIRVVFIGAADPRIPPSLRHAIAATTERTSGCGGMTFRIALNYGSRAEIVRAVRQAAASGACMAQLSEDELGRFMYSPGCPDPELVIRTSGEHRISNFLLWQMAYSELVFSDRLWPDFTTADLDGAIDEYRRRRRRFGGVS